MHAIQVSRFGDASVLSWTELPEPRAGAGEVLVRVTATGVNFADIMSRRGAYAGGAEPPFVPGLDCAGVITAVGDGVAGLHVGQRVAAYPAQGSYCEVAVAKAVLTYPLADEIPDEAGASLNVVVTAYNILKWAGRIAPGDSVLVHAAAGGVGSTAVQLARVFGAGRIFATAGGPEKVALAKAAGADVAIDYLAEDFGRRVLDETGGRGADIILDSVAGDVFTRGLPALAPFGRYVTFGNASGQGAEVPAMKLQRDNRAIVGYTSGGYRKRRPEALRPTVEAVYALIAERRIALRIGTRFPLRDARRAHEFVESRQSTGKVLLIP